MAESGNAAPGGRRKRLSAVFYASLAFSIAFLLIGLLVPTRLAAVLEEIRRIVVEAFGNVYVYTVLGCLVLLIVLAVSPLGRERLGRPEERPDFGFISWVAMLFSAGLGLSYLFRGTAEPLVHFANPPPGVSEPMSEASALAGMRYSFMFWGFHAWAVYGVVAAAVGYAAFRHGRPLLISAALHPLKRNRTRGVLDIVVDVIAVLAILFGIATSIGLGARELNAGLAHTLGVPDAYGVKIVIVACLMTVSTISALTGLGRGIRLLSIANIVLCAALLVFVLVSGPTADVMKTLGKSLVGYAQHLGPMSLASRSGSDPGWTANWTFFYWAWWISWSPFVGVFIARISRGRTIRSLFAGVVLVPGLVTIAWFSVFGGTALSRQRSGAVDATAEAVDSKAVATFDVFATLPFQGITTVVVLIVLALLFITSADSASFMLGSSTSHGSLKPPRPLRLLWAFGAAFASLLLVEGGVASLHGAAVVTAVPFTIILIALAVAFVVSLITDRRRATKRDRSDVRGP